MERFSESELRSDLAESASVKRYSCLKFEICILNFTRVWEEEGVEMRENIHDMISVAKHELFNGMLRFRWFQVLAEIYAPKEHT